MMTGIDAKMLTSGSSRLHREQRVVDDVRTTLSQLLVHLSTCPRDHEARLRAATLANQLCLDAGDGRMADVAEALWSDLPPAMPRAFRAEMARQVAIARAARRAVAMSRRVGQPSPRSLAHVLAQDPGRLAEDVRRRHVMGQSSVAAALLEVALARFPDDPVLHALLPVVRKPVGSI
jgi:hypothetical protein